MTDSIKDHDKEALERIFESLSREQLIWVSEAAANEAKERDELWKLFAKEHQKDE